MLFSIPEYNKRCSFSTSKVCFQGCGSQTGNAVTVIDKVCQHRGGGARAESATGLRQGETYPIKISRWTINSFCCTKEQGNEQ